MVFPFVNKSPMSNSISTIFSLIGDLFKLPHLLCQRLASTGIEKTTIAMPLCDHPLWRHLPLARDSIGGPLSMVYGACVSRGASGALSLSLLVEEGRSTFGIMAGILAKS